MSAKVLIWLALHWTTVSWPSKCSTKQRVINVRVSGLIYRGSQVFTRTQLIPGTGANTKYYRVTNTKYYRVTNTKYCRDTNSKYCRVTNTKYCRDTNTKFYRVLNTKYCRVRNTKYCRVTNTRKYCHHKQDWKGLNRPSSI